MAKKGAPGSAGRWGDDAWEEQNWDSVRKQEQMKQEVLIKASGNSERIRQMVRETEVTRSIGSETLQVLDQQSEQLARIHGEADKIEENLNFADRTIRGMESIWGSVKNMMAKPASSIKTSVTEAMRLEKASSASAGGGSKSQAAAGGGGGAAGRQQQQKKEYADDWQGKLHKMEDEQDKDLDHLGNLVGQLKNMGTDMGASLQSQTKSIERLSDRTDSIDARLGKSNMRIGRML